MPTSSNAKSSNRQYLSREVWEKHITDYKASDLSQLDYANKHCLVLPTFRNWIHRLQRNEQETQFPTFLPVTVNLPELKTRDIEKGLSQDIQITLPNGIQCRFTPQHAPKLILPWIEYLRVLP